MNEANAGFAGKPDVIHINQLTNSDLLRVLKAGCVDFRTTPWFGVFFGLVYAVGGWAVLLLATGSGFYFLAYPLAAGFALIAPFAAAGLYAVSRALEQGRRPDWAEVLLSIRGAGSRDLGWIALITGFIFFIWMDIAFFIYAIFFGFRATGIMELASAIMTTWNGVLFFLVGNAIGACLAMFVFSITVVSFPMLLDRDVDFVTAMITSVRTVRANPKVMSLWALIIAAALLFSLLTFLAALVVVLPILGHASWHLYRRTVAR